MLIAVATAFWAVFDNAFGRSLSNIAKLGSSRGACLYDPDFGPLDDFRATLLTSVPFNKSDPQSRTDARENQSREWPFRYAAYRESTELILGVRSRDTRATLRARSTELAGKRSTKIAKGLRKLAS